MRSEVGCMVPSRNRAARIHGIEVNHADPRAITEYVKVVQIKTVYRPNLNEVEKVVTFFL